MLLQDEMDNRSDDMRRIQPKHELELIMADDLENLKSRIFELSLLDRITLLIASIVDRDREANAAMDGLIALIGRLAVFYTPANQIRISEKLKDVADQIDREALAHATVVMLSD